MLFYVKPGMPFKLHPHIKYLLYLPSVKVIENPKVDMLPKWVLSIVLGSLLNDGLPGCRFHLFERAPSLIDAQGVKIEDLVVVHP